MKYRGYFYGAFTTSLNILLNAVTFGNYLWLEGRVRGKLFRNWARRFRYKPARFVQPASEQEIVDLVKNSTGLRFFGSAHSFNDGVVADNTLVSLDRFSGGIFTDRSNKRLTVRGGTRVRDVVRMLLQEGWAFRALPSHDAQSIAGILSTDVHGTGHDWGFVSDLVTKLKIVDGRGQIHECQPQDDLFKAAIGGVGAVGIITEVTVEAVDRFNVAQKFEVSDLAFVEQHLDQLLQDNDHFSLYLFPFTTKCQISTWNRTDRSKSFLGPVREFIAISADALLAAWFGNLMAYAGLLPRLSSLTHSLKQGTNLVLESNRAFNRTIYHLHQELEFTVPYEETLQMCERFVELYEAMYRHSPLPYALFEVRFTPAGHDRTLIGAGRDRCCAWIDLVCNDSHGFEKYYAAAEELMKEVGARPHLGKFCDSYGPDDLAELHQNHFARFQLIRQEYDPDGKFANQFTRRLFG